LRLRVYGAYQQPELPCLLRDVDCVIVPSLVPEAGPVAPWEALALGLPVLAARLGALPEIVTEGENGFAFDPTRPAELAAILNRLWWDEGLLNRLRQGARATRVGTVAEHAEAIRAVYREAVAERKRQGPAPDGDVAEIRFLHEALLDLGVGGTG
jgi:glycosyltransferase involved in cell wall biosynthesis